MEGIEGEFDPVQDELFDFLVNTRPIQQRTNVEADYLQGEAPVFSDGMTLEEAAPKDMPLDSDATGDGQRTAANTGAPKRRMSDLVSAERALKIYDGIQSFGLDFLSGEEIPQNKMDEEEFQKTLPLVADFLDDWEIEVSPTTALVIGLGSMAVMKGLYAWNHRELKDTIAAREADNKRLKQEVEALKAIVQQGSQPAPTYARQQGTPPQKPQSTHATIEELDGLDGWDSGATANGSERENAEQPEDVAYTVLDSELSDANRFPTTGELSRLAFWKLEFDKRFGITDDGTFKYRAMPGNHAQKISKADGYQVGELEKYQPYNGFRPKNGKMVIRRCKFFGELFECPETSDREFCRKGNQIAQYTRKRKDWANEQLKKEGNNHA